MVDREVAVLVESSSRPCSSAQTSAHALDSAADVGFLCEVVPDGKVVLETAPSDKRETDTVVWLARRVVSGTTECDLLGLATPSTDRPTGKNTPHKVFGVLPVSAGESGGRKSADERRT